MDDRATNQWLNFELGSNGLIFENDQRTKIFFKSVQHEMERWPSIMAGDLSYKLLPHTIDTTASPL